MSRLSVCVAMCTFNGMPYLPEQLESLAAQVRQPDQLVVVDDCSSDDTLSVLEEFARRAPFPVRLLRNERNLGYRKNFEKAIRHSQGDVIALCDQDDVWLPEKLASVEAVFRTSPRTGLLFSDAEVVDAALRPLGFGLWEAVQFTEERQARVREGEAFELLLKQNFVTGATMAFRSSLRPLVLPLDEESVHDAWVALLVAAVAEVAIIPEPLIRYRQHATNQIGASPVNLVKRLARARNFERQGLRERHRKLLRVQERVRNRSEMSTVKRAALEETITHLGNRIALPDQRAHRIPPIVRELARGGYSRRANGFSSALRDLII